MKLTNMALNIRSHKEIGTALLHLYKIPKQAQLNSLWPRNAHIGGKATKKNKGMMITIVNILSLAGRQRAHSKGSHDLSNVLFIGRLSLFPCFNYQ